MLSKGDVERISSLWVPSEWPDFADKTFAATGHSLPFSHYVARVRHLGLSGDTLVDAGCGTGRWSFAFGTVFNRVVGIDKTTDRIATAQWLRERFDTPGIQFESGDIRKLAFDDNCVDVVYNNSVAFGQVSLKDIFSEAYRILKIGGIFYIGLNGPGYGYSGIEHPDPVIRERRRQTVYYTYCEVALGSLPTDLFPGARLNQAARSHLPMAAGPAEFLAAISCSAAQVAAADAIVTDLGPEFGRRLMDEFAAFAEGRQAAFKRDKAGRDYEPGEIVETALAAGFHRVESAPDGWLSLGPDGSVTKTPCADAKASPPEFKGRLRVFETLMWKPDK